MLLVKRTQDDILDPRKQHEWVLSVSQVQQAQDDKYPTYKVLLAYCHNYE